MKLSDLVLILEQMPEKKLEIFSLVDAFMVDGEIDFDKAIEQADAVARASEEVEIYVEHVKVFTRSLYYGL